MSNYSKRVVFDYICGNDIEGYNIDELEDDYKFMGEVINYTGDKKLYNLCSNRVKSKYKFVKFVVNRFKDDLNFICEVADYYLERSKNELNRIELSLIMSKLISNRNCDYCRKYVLLSEASYSIRRVELAMIKDEMEFDNVLYNELGMGFFIIFDDFNTSDIVMNFFAKNFVDDIFIDNNIDLEKKLHCDFDDVFDIDKRGINNYLLDFIYSYDKYLSTYISTHLDVLDSIKKRIDKYRMRWENYSAFLECEIYDTLLKEVHDYMIAYEFECSFNEIEVLYYLGNEFRILDKISKYDPFIDGNYGDFKIKVNLDKSSFNFKDLFHYNKIKQIVADILNLSNNDEEINNFINMKNNAKSKILKLDFNTGKVLSK